MVCFRFFAVEWKISLGLAPDPEAGVQMVQDARIKRMEAKGIFLKKSGGDDEEEEEEEEEDEEQEPEAEEEESGDEGGDDEDSEEEEEEDDEPKVVIKPLYVPLKGKKLGKEEIWDNFTIKALKMNDDDEDEDEGMCFFRGTGFVLCFDR